MDYEISYPITQLPGEYIVLNYTKGFRDVNAEYKGEIIVEGISAKDLKKGVKFDHPILGKVQLKFAGEKLVVNVIVDGYHSPINRDHPKRRIANVGSFFWTLMGFTCFTFLLQAYSAYEIKIPEYIIIGPLFTALAILAYSITAYNLKKGKSAFFWLGLSVFIARIAIIVYFSVADMGSIDGLSFGLGMIFRLAFLVGLLFCIPLVLHYRKHEPYLKLTANSDPSVIDTDMRKR